tara:strand:+ start:228 stop:917 length:690 start_codon:yes stop_codon:yes gene_type:complete
MNDNLQSEDIGDLSKALTSFQDKCSVINFDSEVKVKNKDGVHIYTYKYLTLPKLREDTRKILVESELAIFQTTSSISGQFLLVTTLSHSSGQWIRGFYPLMADMKDPQKIGSVLSYAKRYAMASILGIVADGDDDGQYGNMTREEEREKALEKQKKIEEEIKKEREKEATQKLMAVETALENCFSLEELQTTWTEKCIRDVTWLRSNSVKDYQSLEIKKNELKETLGKK